MSTTHRHTFRLHRIEQSSLKRYEAGQDPSEAIPTLLAVYEKCLYCDTVRRTHFSTSDTRRERILT